MGNQKANQHETTSTFSSKDEKTYTQEDTVRFYDSSVLCENKGKQSF